MNQSNLYMTATVVAVSIMILAGSTFTQGADVQEPENLLSNGSFDEGLQDWNKLWARSGDADISEEIVLIHGDSCIRVTHTGSEDWALNRDARFDVNPGDIFELTASIRVEGEGSAMLCAALYDEQGEAIHWSLGGDAIREGDVGSGRDGQVRTFLIIQNEGRSMSPRIIGSGPCIVQIDDVELRRLGNVRSFRSPDLPETLTLSNDLIDVSFSTSSGSLTVTDLRTPDVPPLRQANDDPHTVLNATSDGERLQAVLVDRQGRFLFAVEIAIESDSPELLYEITCVSIEALREPDLLSGYPTGAVEKYRNDATGMSGELDYPYHFVSPDDSYAILPMNEGIAYPVDWNRAREAARETLTQMQSEPGHETLSPEDADSFEPARYFHLYGGHGLCMAFYGVAGLEAALQDPPAEQAGYSSYMAIVETADDAHMALRDADGKLAPQPLWVPQLGRFGPPRRIRYVFFDRGGYVAMCKRYREYSQQIGRFKTLLEKERENPNVDLLIGAVNVWNWDSNPAETCAALQESGINRILWSRRASPDQLELMNRMGVLTGRYDIFQDCMDPSIYPRLRGIHPDWTSEGWPDQIVINANGDWAKGWPVETKDGERYPCARLCDLHRLSFAEERVTEELATHPYRARFIDTSTAAPWSECYHPDHPTTRTQSREARMRVLEYMSRDSRLVTGSETGHDAAVPYLHYFEGMMSLGHYRVPDAGRRMSETWETPPSDLAVFQTGHYFRLPLWELVYHDCVVSTWYWGDYNNKLPTLWRRRDLWNALYGSAPMFMFTTESFAEEPDRFAESYRTATPVARETAHREMLSHEWLTADHTVQRTTFEGGKTVTVNFGNRPFTMPDGTIIPPMDLN